MIAIEESKKVDSMSIDELLGSLQTYEASLKPKVKSKGIALKVINEESEDDDTEMALLVRKEVFATF